MIDYWPWWLGALSLSWLTVAAFSFTGRSLAVSGVWTRALHRREQRALAKAWLATQDQEALERAMLASTVAAFGADATRMAASSSPVQASAEPSWRVPPPVTWGANLTFLACLALGGTLAAWLRGELDGAGLGLDSNFVAAFGSGWPWALLGGGALVGFGTRMSGGCTSGHGLSGCSALRPASLIATVVFFAVGAAVSLTLSWVIR